MKNASYIHTLRIGHSLEMLDFLRNFLIIAAVGRGRKCFLSLSFLVPVFCRMADRRKGGLCCLSVLTQYKVGFVFVIESGGSGG